MHTISYLRRTYVADESTRASATTSCRLFSDVIITMLRTRSHVEGETKVATLLIGGFRLLKISYGTTEKLSNGSGHAFLACHAIHHSCYWPRYLIKVEVLKHEVQRTITYEVPSPESNRVPYTNSHVASERHDHTQLKVQFDRMIGCIRQ